MFCPDCSFGLDDVDVSQPCPGCGGDRRSSSVQAESAAANMGVPDVTAVGHSQLPGGSSLVDVGSATYRSSSLAGPQGDRQEFEGAPAQNEQGVLAVCGVLREALLKVGEVWGAFEPQPPPINDVDAVAENDAGVRLQVQVTRAEQRVWADVARDGGAEQRLTVGELADDLLQAIEKKSSKLAADQRAKLLLALDAIRAPGFAQALVIDAFREQYGDRVAALGFRAIWLVGPTAALAYRLG